MNETKLRLIPLGGMGNVTKNMYLYEYEDKILIVDCGIGFPDATMLGIDLLIPDVSYLQDKKDRIVGMVLTHGHDDHIGGLPYILPMIGSDFPIYGSPLTLGFAQDRLSDFEVTANFMELPQGELKIGPFSIENLYVTHSVPDARHIAVTTPDGVTVYHGTDFKFDLNPVDGRLSEMQKIALIGSRGVDVLLSDSLNSEIDNFSRSESTLTDTFEREIRGIPGKFIVTVMSSNIHRIQQIINVASGHNRKVAFIGRSIEQNVKTAVKMGMLKLPKGVINKRQIEQLPPNQVTVIIAGSQGQSGSSLARAATGEHNLIKIKPEDKVLFASEAIPGNEQNVYGTIDSLSRTGADVTYPDLDESVHVSGHSSSIEQKILISLTQPKHLIPIGGTFHHMIEYRKNCREMGYKDKNIHLLDNGQVVEIGKDRVAVAEQLDLKNVMVDGLGIGDIGTIVLRDRQRMSADGIVVILVPIEQQTGQVEGEIEIISRGFVYMKESSELIDKTKLAVKEMLQKHKDVVTNWQEVRKRIETGVERLLYEETERRPLLLTVVIEV